jgi:osmoprotectant transport system permease protein
VGATSLGNYIFTGLQTRNFAAVMTGCVAASGLALLLDGLVRTLESAVRRRSRRQLATVLSLFALLYLYTGITLARPFFAGGRERIVIGAKTFTEQYILSEILAQRVRADTGLATDAVQSLGSTVAFDALRSGEIDVYVDYSGTIWATIMKRDTVPEERGDVLSEVKRHLRERYGVVLVAALGFENTYALAMRDRQAEQLIGDLVPYARRMTIGGDYEFFGRTEWRALRAAYGLEFTNTRSMDSSLMYQAAAQGDVDVISAFSTDGRITALGLRVLDDDRGAIPPYDAIILASPRLAHRHPEVIESLARLAGTIDDAHMRQMNLAVDRDGASPGAVAAEFLAGDRGGVGGFV